MALKMLIFFAVASLGAWFLLFAGLGTRRDVRRRAEQEYTRATGVIVDYVRKETISGRSGTVVTWRPVVEYTAEGRAYRAEYENSMDRAQFPEGMAVEVLYDVSQPSRFHLESDPVFIHRGDGAIRVALIWILASAALTVALAVFVGGARFNLDDAWYRLRMLFRRRR